METNTGLLDYLDLPNGFLYTEPNARIFSCGSCGFGFLAEHHNVDDPKTWTCPLCHPNASKEAQADIRALAEGMASLEVSCPAGDGDGMDRGN